MRANAPWAVIAGGGTAGHVLPGLAVGRALVRRGHPPATIHYIGSERGIEARLVPEAGFALTLLPGRGIQRRLTLANVGAVVGLLRALVSAFALVARHRPAVVVALGGYASVPCALAALLLRVPVVVAEQNSVPGAANRLVARFARASAVSFPGTPLPRAVLTGNPVREEVLAVDRTTDREQARASLDVPPNRTLILAFGGSLGARRINQAVVGAATAWRSRRDLAVRHVVGDRDWTEVGDRMAEEGLDRSAPGGLVYQPVRYEDRMPDAYAAADLVVCRSGATTVAELAVVGVASVLVPFPGATGDHQTANARALAEAGAAVVVADDDLTAERLSEVVQGLLDRPDRLAAMAHAARGVARPDAADRVAALVEEHARDD